MFDADHIRGESVSASGCARAEDLFPLVYDELRRIAERYLARERRDHTLQPTALVNEAYLRLSDLERAPWQNRAHFLAIAARVMRQVLVAHAVRRRAQKRSGRLLRIVSDDAVALTPGDALELLALDDILRELAGFDPDQARIVELRFFGGLTVHETAEVLGFSVRRVEREWALARAWLRYQLERGATTPLGDASASAS